MSEDSLSKENKKQIHASQLEGKVIENLKLLKSMISGEKVRLFQFQQSELTSQKQTDSSIETLKKKIISEFLHLDLKALAAISIPKKLRSECFDLLIQAWRKKIASEYSQVLALLDLKFSKESLRALVIALSLNVELKALRIDHCDIGVLEAKLLAVFIKVHPSITVFHLNHNPLTDEGFLSLAAALLQNESIKNVSLNEVQLTDKSLALLLELLDLEIYQSMSLENNLFSEKAISILREKAEEKKCDLTLE